MFKTSKYRSKSSSYFLNNKIKIKIRTKIIKNNLLHGVSVVPPLQI